MSKSFKFLVVGGSNTLLTFLLYVFLIHSNWNFKIALLVSYAAGISLGFLFNLLWTFKVGPSTENSEKYSKFGKYIIVYIVVFLLNLAILNWLVSNRLLDAIWGQVVAVGIATLISFLLQNSWVFKASDKQ